MMALTGVDLTIQKLYFSIKRDLMDPGNVRYCPPAGFSHIYNYLSEVGDGKAMDPKHTSAVLDLALEIKKITQARKEYY